MKNLLIIHPEGNINYNPNLFGIIKMLSEKGCHIDIKCAKSKLAEQTTTLKNVNFIFFPDIRKKIIKRLLNYSRFLWKPKYYFLPLTKYNYWDFIIGVDREGVIEAMVLSEKYNIPFALLSYEILFPDEVGNSAKYFERIACKKISFAICQDKVRSAHLAEVNKIPLEKIINIPVAGAKVQKEDRAYFLHEKFKLDRKIKIALFIGTIAKWAYFDELIHTVQEWPDDWVLIINSKYSSLINEINNKAKKKSIYFYKEDNPTLLDLSRLILSADVGLAFYKPFGDKHPLSGNNLKYIGLASGKISTYLQYGLPVIVNEIGEMSDYVKQYGLGYVIDNISALPSALEKMERNKFSENCYRFFCEKFDLGKTIIPLLNKLESIN